MEELEKLKSMAPLKPDKYLRDLALYFAKEQGVSGEIGHKRKNCKRGYSGECCSYGHDKGLEYCDATLNKSQYFLTWT